MYKLLKILITNYRETFALNEKITLCLNKCISSQTSSSIADFFKSLRLLAKLSTIKAT